MKTIGFAYDIAGIPFSAKGSYFAVSQYPQNGKMYIRDIHGGDEADSELYEISADGYVFDEFVCERSEISLRFYLEKEPSRYFKILCTGDDRLFIKTAGLTLRLKGTAGVYNTLLRIHKKKYEHQFYNKQLKVAVSVLDGTCDAKSDWTVRGSAEPVFLLGSDKNCSCIVLHSFSVSVCADTENDFEAAEKQLSNEYGEWEKLFPCLIQAHTHSHNLARYILWNNFVHAHGALSCDAVYMSKNNMYNIWSWDNCFTALALGEACPEAAYGQLKIFFDKQDRFGAYPDYVNDVFASFNCLKPPIHAWVYNKLLDMHPLFLQKEYFIPAYESFCRAAEYWLHFRRPNGRDFPLYYHGNDSGWDNASVFHKGVPVESPDLSAFLIQKADMLSSFAYKLGKKEESIHWKKQADDLFALYMKRFYHNGKFYAWDAAGMQRITTGNSLLLYLPLLIGYRMDKNVRDKLVCDLERNFEGTYGLVTEQKSSPLYKEGGYWLGPVWAPVTYLFIDALRTNGYSDFAERLAHRFFDLTEVGLMAENYDAFSGCGYDDSAFTWSACVFLQLEKEFA